LHRRDALARQCETEIQRGADYHTSRAIQLLEQLFVHQHTAVLRSHQVGPSAGRHADFIAAATHLRSHRADGIIFPDFPFLQLRYPYVLHALGLQDPDVLVTDQVSLRQEFLAPGSKYSTTKNFTV